MRGFALTLATVILITFLVAILSVESQRVALQESFTSMRARADATDLLLTYLDSEGMKGFMATVSKNILYEMDTEVIEGECMSNAKKEYCERVKEKFSEYLGAIEGRAEALGFELEHKDIECNAEMSDPFKVETTIRTELTLRSPDAVITKEINLVYNTSIEGLPDPLTGHESAKLGKEYSNSDRMYLPIIRGEKPEKPQRMGIAWGFKWVYGEVMGIDEALELKPAEQRKTIVCVDKDKVDEYTDVFENFSGAILVSDEEVEHSEGTMRFTGTDKDGNPCEVEVKVDTYKKGWTYRVIHKDDGDCDVDYDQQVQGDVYDDDVIIVYEQADDDEWDIGIPFVVAESCPKGNRLTVGSQSIKDSYYPMPPEVYEEIFGRKSGIYNIESVREAVICAHFHPSPSAPDFFSRLECETNGDSQGIETFLVGEWVVEDYSHVDHEYWSEDDGPRVMGMPGCKTIDMCDSEGVVRPFRISREAAERYEMEDLLLEE